jgi:hypothetical protein
MCRRTTSPSRSSITPPSSRTVSIPVSRPVPAVEDVDDLLTALERLADDVRDCGVKDGVGVQVPGHGVAVVVAPSVHEAAHDVEVLLRHGAGALRRAVCAAR